MGMMTCVECNKEWQEKGFSINTVCDSCKKSKKDKKQQQASNDFEMVLRELLEDHELEKIKDVDWEELTLLGAEYVASQLRWKLLEIKKGRV